MSISLAVALLCLLIFISGLVLPVYGMIRGGKRGGLWGLGTLWSALAAAAFFPLSVGIQEGAWRNLGLPTISLGVVGIGGFVGWVLCFRKMLHSVAQARRDAMGLCRNCGYSRKDLSWETPCPECGKRGELPLTDPT